MQRTRSKRWFVYILLCKDKTLYTGITNDLQKRFQLHLSGKGAKYTRSRGVKKILFSKKYLNRSIAAKKEIQIKAMPRTEKLQLIKHKCQTKA